MKKILLASCLSLLSAPSLMAQSSYLDQAFTDYFRRSHGWTAGDATISILLPDGRSVWLFGDSFIDHYDSTDNSLPCLFQVRNCFTVQDTDDLNSMTTYIDYAKNGIEQTYFKIGSVGNSVYWPGQGFVVQDTLFVFLQKFNGSNYKFQGNHIAKILLPSFTLLGITQFPFMGKLMMGQAVMHDDASGYYYIYGNKLNWIVYEPYVARTTFQNLQSGNWEFYSDSGWTSSPALATKISEEIVSPGFSVISLKGKYFMVTQENGYLTCGLGRNIYCYEALSPTGPFITPRTLYTIEDQINGHYLLTYNAEAHPQFLKNDELLISYNLNDKVEINDPNACPSQCPNAFTDRMSADSYRPKFVRVPLKMMGIKSGLLDAVQGIQVQPNPVLQNLTILLHAGQAQRGTLTIFNKMGQVMKDLPNVNLSAGDNMLQLDVSGLPPDVYMIVMNPEAGNGTGILWERKMFVRR